MVRQAKDSLHSIQEVEGLGRILHLQGQAEDIFENQRLGRHLFRHGGMSLGHFLHHLLEALKFLLQAVRNKQEAFIHFGNESFHPGAELLIALHGWLLSQCHGGVSLMLFRFILVCSCAD